MLHSFSQQATKELNKLTQKHEKASKKWMDEKRSMSDEVTAAKKSADA